MKHSISILSLLAFAACSEGPSAHSGPNQALMGLPAKEIAATLDLAEQVAVACSDYRVDQSARNYVVGFSGGIPGRRMSEEELVGIRLASDPVVLEKLRAEFERRHLIDLDRDSSCEAIGFEQGQASIFGLLFEPV